MAGIDFAERELSNVQAATANMPDFGTSLFRYANGSQWFVSHYLFERR